MAHGAAARFICLGHTVHLASAAAVALCPQSEAGRDSSSDHAVAFGSPSKPSSHSPVSYSSSSSSSTSPPLLSSSSSPPTSTSAISPGNLAEESISLLERRDHGRTGGLAPRVREGPMTRQGMDEEAVAGIAVGVVLGVALLACCLYPVVIRRIKRRKRANCLSYEYGHTTLRGNPPISLRRLSSSGSGKQGDGPQHDQADARNAYGYGYAHAVPWVHGQPQGDQPSTPEYVNASSDQNLTIEPADPDAFSNPYPYCHRGIAPGEMLPAHQIVLKGTSEDYYCPHIPSEAFGMYATPDPEVAIQKPERTASRTDSLAGQIRHIFRRNVHHGSDSHTSHGDDGTRGVSYVQGATPLQHFTTPPPRGLGDSDPYHVPRSRAPFSAADPSQSHPASPATVNPMDIMPASTESEMWHRTDHQLLESTREPRRSNSTPAEYVQPPPPQEPQQQPAPPHFVAPSAPPEPSGRQSPAPSSAPPEVPTQTQSTSALIQGSESSIKRKPSSSTGDQAPQGEASSQARLGPTSLPSRSSTSVPHRKAELSVPEKGAASTTTQSTPSSQVDSASPESPSSSDYHQSASPRPLGVPSPKGGAYCCDEPGCNQVFDQPHKLKHHQRYHSKDHRCPYPTCGKGFGTKTHLQRHINDRHEKKKKFHCSIQGCDYSRAGGKAFPRKDNWKRHMTKIHGMDHRQLPEPVETDQEMADA